jgi:hypothetical protein
MTKVIVWWFGSVVRPAGMGTVVDPVTEVEPLEFPARLTERVLGAASSIASVIEETTTLPPFWRAIVIGMVPWLE